MDPGDEKEKMRDGAASRAGEFAARVDFDRLDLVAELLRRSGDATVRFELLGAFAKSSAQKIVALRGAIESAEVSAAVSGAHALRGSSLNLGATRLAAMAAKVEDDARDSGVLPGAKVVDAIADELASFVAIVRSRWAQS